MAARGYALLIYLREFFDSAAGHLLTRKMRRAYPQPARPTGENESVETSVPEALAAC